MDSPYPKKRTQFVSIGNFSTTNKEIQTGIPQELVLRLLLFSLYIKDPHNSVKHARVYYFADNTRIILSDTSLEILPEQINKDLFNLSNWLKANKLSLNIKKAELVIFRSKKLKVDHSFKFKLEYKRLVPTKSAKCLRVLASDRSFYPIFNKRFDHLETLLTICRPK